MKKTALILVLLFLFHMIPAQGEEMGPEEKYLKGQESWNRVIHVLGKDYLVFAQNSPEWARMRCNNDSDETLKVHEFACITFAFANAMVNVVPYRSLPLITEIMRYTPKIDRYSAAPYQGKRESDRFVITEECDFLRYWPLTIVSYAAGNNMDLMDEPTGTFFINTITNYFQVDKTVTTEIDEAFTAMDEGALALTCFYAETTRYGTVGHYFVFAGRDEEYIYMLDSNFMKQYPMPMGEYVELMEPGLQRIKIEDLPKLTLGYIFIFRPKEGFEPYTEERYQEILDLSNQ